MDAEYYLDNWNNPVHKIGRWALSAVCITSLFPVAYLYFVHGISRRWNGYGAISS